MTKDLLTKIKEMEEKLGQGWIKELEGISTPEALKAKAETLGISLTDAVTTEAIQMLNGDEAEELSEEELSTVAGGYFYA
ncbi:MAG TPA: hypothetical protein PK466_13800 [Thermotogota bacterium]|nr:hypothetical protein [Thermotogota bacterium]HPJ90206.1 hypothetical protein [Thermotogota bacterium]HPR97400.1 hypothetical protein [Thermotogota bacterium]